MKFLFIFAGLLLFAENIDAAAVDDCLAANSQNSAETMAVCDAAILASQDSIDDISKIYITQASYLIKKSQFNEANEILNLALNKNAKFLENGRYRYNWLRKKGALYFTQEVYDDALPYFEQAFEVAKVMGENDLMAISYNDVGSIYSVMHKYQQALEWLKQSLDIQTQLENYGGAALSLSNIAEIYLSLEQHANALSYFEQSLSLHEKSLKLNNKDKEEYDLNVAKVYLSMALVYAALNNKNEALKFVAQSLSIYQQYQLIGQQVHVLSTKGKLLLDWDELDAASEVIELAIDLEQGLESQNNLELKVNRVYLLLKMGQWQLAEAAANQALVFAENRKSQDIELNLLGLLAEIHQQAGNYAEAVTVLKKLQQVNEDYLESKFNKSRGILLAEIEINQKQRKVSQLEEQQRINELQANQDRLIFVVVSMVLSGVVIYLLYLLRRHKKYKTTVATDKQVHHQKLHQLSVNHETIAKLFSSIASKYVCFDVTGRIYHWSEDHLQLNSSSKMQKEFQDLWHEFLPHIESGEDLQKDLLINLRNSGHSVWIHQMPYLDDLLVCLFLAKNNENSATLEDAENIKKYSEFKLQFSDFINQDSYIPVIKAAQLNPITTALKSFNKAADSDQTSSFSQSELKSELVDLMYVCIEIWHKATGKSNVDLAEESGLWLVSIEEGHLRTRTLNRYTDINKIPDNPRWRQVVKTAHFILADCQLTVSDRLLMNEKVEKVMTIIRSMATLKK